MKTNNVIPRDDGFFQRTKDGYFNATALIDEWNKSNPEKQMARYKVNKSTKDFICQLQKEGIDSPIISGRGKGGATWMHPKLFIDFAMWVSIEFKSKVIDYVIDGLILSRTDAGDYYTQMSAKILDKYVEIKGSKPPAYIYIKEANMIKKIVGVEGKNRNNMSELELDSITKLQKLNTTMINKGIGIESREKHLIMLFESLSI